MPVILIHVKIKPNARVSSLEREEGGNWVARVKAAPVDGKANDELITLVAKQFQCRKVAVSIKSGASARRKLLRVDIG